MALPSIQMQQQHPAEAPQSVCNGYSCPCWINCNSSHWRKEKLCWHFYKGTSFIIFTINSWWIARCLYWLNRTHLRGVLFPFSSHSKPQSSLLHYLPFNYHAMMNMITHLTLTTSWLFVAIAKWAAISPILPNKSPHMNAVDNFVKRSASQEHP